jgi:hypothetical protein
MLWPQLVLKALPFLDRPSMLGDALNRFPGHQLLPLNDGHFMPSPAFGSVPKIHPTSTLIRRPSVRGRSTRETICGS